MIPNKLQQKREEYKALQEELDTIWKARDIIIKHQNYGTNAEVASQLEQFANSLEKPVGKCWDELSELEDLYKFVLEAKMDTYIHAPT